MRKDNYSFLFAKEVVENCSVKRLENLTEVEKKAIYFCLDMFLEPENVVVERDGEELKWYCPTCGEFFTWVNDDYPAYVEKRKYYRLFRRCRRCGQLINFDVDER